MSIETNERGNVVQSSFIGPMVDRYCYDYRWCANYKGYRVYKTDQDFAGFGVWINDEKREIITFCEGDEIRIECDTAESFAAELQAMDQYYRNA